MVINSGCMEVLSFVVLVLYMLEWLMFFSDMLKVLMVGIVSVLGVIVGLVVVVLVMCMFCWEGFVSVEDMGNYIIGGILMGIGGVMVLGCMIG